MKIPADAALREAFYWSVIQECLVSRGDRRAEYDVLRNYYLFGSAPGNEAASHNKIFAAIDTLTSFLFAADTTRFAVKLGAGVDKAAHLPRVPPLTARLMDRWEDSNADIVFGNAVTWALVKNTAIVKLIQRGKETHPFLVDAENFGVYREDVPMLDRQEAFVEVVLTTKEQLARDLMNHPNKDLILARLSASRTVEDDLPAGIQRLVTSSFYPTTQGNVPDVLNLQDMYRPRTAAELVETYELWLWDDEIEGEHPQSGKPGGYRVVTLADPSICIYDRPAYDPESKDGLQMWLEGDHPYTQVCPNPAPDLFWGYSEVRKLCALQDLRERAVHQIEDLLDRNVTPPKALTGMWGAVEEKDLAMRKIGALLSSQEPMAKVQEFKPQIPQDLWAFIRELDAEFDETIALNAVLKGRGEAGVRSKGQTDRLAQLGSSRPKKRALIVEDSLERLATLYLKLDQAHNKDKLHTVPLEGKSEPFIAEQFTKDFMVKVDAHSSSPVFVEDQKNGMYAMFDRGIVDGEAIIDVEQPQNAQVLKERYKQLEKARAAAKEKEQAMKEAESQGKLTRLNQG